MKLFDEGLKDRLKAAFEDIVFDEPLCRHTSMGVGGPADGFIYAWDGSIRAILDFCGENGIPTAVLGNGSNIIASDEGFRGLVICVGKGMNSVEVCGDNEIRAGAGAKLSQVADIAARNNIAGFEFLAGIPGNLGGALVMNAGAYGGEISALVQSVTYIKDGEMHCASADSLEYGYRKSYFMKNPDAVITGARLRGTAGTEAEIRALMEEYLARRSASQPLEYPSAGSFFKRPEGHFAGKLIQDAGLRGLAVGGAQVSEKHAGFIINKGGATCADIKALSDEVRKRVFEQFSVTLEPEVRFLGE